MDNIELIHLAYGAFFIFIILFVLWKNKKKGHRLIEEITSSLRVTISSFKEITFSEYYGLPEGCALKTDEWHVGYTLYFACDTTLELDAIIGILLVDLTNEHKYVIIHKQDTVAHHERQIIILKKGRRTFKMYVTHGAMSNGNNNLFSVHVELNH